MRFALAQLGAPPWKATVALLHVPGPSVIVPKSRFWSDDSTSDFETLALMVADCVAACAGALIHPTLISVARAPAKIRVGEVKATVFP
jgi:hypothetical protein